MGIKSIDEIKNETLVQYIDVCKETLDGIVADNDNHESFISELRQGLEPKDKLFTKRDSILCPSWCFEPNTLNDLKDMGYLDDMGRHGRRLIHKERLLTRWITAYPEQLKPKKVIGKFDAVDPEFWRYKDLPLEKAYWGGEVAAAKLNKYLKPDIVTIYNYKEEDLIKYMIENRTRKDPKGKIEIIKAFWEEGQKRPYKNLVHPILIYADLQATGDPRNIETAEIIYGREIAEFIGED